jgi:hypothetical protein
MSLAPIRGTGYDNINRLIGELGDQFEAIPFMNHVCLETAYVHHVFSARGIDMMERTVVRALASAANNSVRAVGSGNR